VATGTGPGGNTYNDPNYVPIGARVSVFANLPAGNTAPVTWTGGTVYSSYALGAADSVAPASLSPEQKVNNTGATYSFIADAIPRTYTITATAGAGSSTITFTTDGPKGTLTQQPTGGYANFNHDKTDPADTPNSDFVRYSNPAVTGLPQSAGMYIKAQVTPSPNVGGTLMFLQTITTQRTVKGTKGGAAVTGTWSGNGQVAADNGGSQTTDPTGVKTGLVGYPTTASIINHPPDTSTYVTSWPCPVSGPVPDQFMVDTPVVSAPVANKATLLQVGTTDPKGNPVPESFSTYLMFQGENGVWVPISQLNWSWSITATSDGMGNWNPPTNQTSPPPAPPASPPSFGPSWGVTLTAGSYNYL